MDDLGTALRTWRDRLTPADVGLPHLSPRRVAGLRRSELAQLSGISVEYVVRLEQGRASTPSAQVCAALARALQLSDGEQAHLFRLAGHAMTPDRVPQMIPGSVHRIVEQLSTSPVLVCDAGWQMLHWNPLFAAALGDPTRSPAGERNVLLLQFEGRMPRIRQTAAELDAFERSLVADLRATTSRYPKDPGLRSLVARLRDGERFRELWEQRTVGEHQGAAKVVEHPTVGDIAVESNVLTTQGSDLRIVVDTPRGAEAASRLALLSAVGIQEMASPDALSSV
ncbi:MAG TPA: helix-turn-helix transcriptional regulator [Promicromonospora sp.]|nr:helix-turn-helix transcriptional regulator [Promicromonospora sp.]